MLAALGRSIARHPLPTLATWLVAVVLAGGAALGAFGTQGLFDRVTNGASQVPGEAKDGSALLAAHRSATREALMQLDGLDVDSAAVQTRLGSAVRTVAAAPGVVAVAAPLTSAGAAARPLVSSNGRSALVTATVSGSPGEAASDAALSRARTALAASGRSLAHQTPGARWRVATVDDLGDDINDQVESDLRTGEAAALPLSLLVMVVVFGGVLAAGIPILGALATISGSLAALWGFSYVTDLDPSVVNVVTVLGLGLCIDYGLLVVSRYREELRAVAGDGRPPGTATGHQRSRAGSSEADRPPARHRAPAPDLDREGRSIALERTVASAGRTVTFSAVTVAISLSGLLVFGAPSLRSMGVASVSVVLIALAVALTLVPALLAAGGARLTRRGAASRVPGLRFLTARLGDISPPTGFFSALAQRVQRRPWWVLGVVTAVLLLLAWPAASLRLRADGVKLLPAGNPSRQFFVDLDDHFPLAASPTFTVVTRAGGAATERYADQVRELPDVRLVDPVLTQRGVSSFGVRVAGDPDGARAREAVTELRDHRPAFRTWVTGDTADVVDFQHDLRSRAPLAAALVVLATFALLFLLTGSVLVPLKALLVNVLSLGACLGVVVWIFQDGHLETVLDYGSTGGIETFVPPLALAFGFGLAMDYEVFLLSRILEAREHGLRTDAAVVVGLQRSGRIITSAAGIIILVFLGFVAGHLLVIKQVGFALAIAVAVDASAVRMLLVPAIMTLLGDRNWWAPRPLRALHARIGLREAGPSGSGESGEPGIPHSRHRGVPSGQGGDRDVPSQGDVTVRADPTA